VPFISGGGIAIVEDLERALREHGHEVDTVMLPFWSDPARMPQQMLALRLLDLSHAGDLLVAIRTPSYILQHPQKVIWFIHHHRPAYDLWDTEFEHTPSVENERVREAVIEADNLFLREAERIFTNSKIVGERLRSYNGIESKVLYPPLGDPSGYRSDSFGDYIFYPSRITPIKRQFLLVEAMAYVRSGVKLVLAGRPDAPGHLERIHEAIRRHDLGDRVELRSDWISEQEKRDLFANAMACAYIPFDEDSYGYVSLESFHSRKPVLTLTDSGGTLELITDGVNGRVLPPDPEAIAEAIDELHADKQRAATMGEAGYQRLSEMQISWDNVVNALVA
jgi:glycosyltransferase involved in cell wall biosynthesis